MTESWILIWGFFDGRSRAAANTAKTDMLTTVLTIFLLVSVPMAVIGAIIGWFAVRSFVWACFWSALASVAGCGLLVASTDGGIQFRMAWFVQVLFWFGTLYLAAFLAPTILAAILTVTLRRRLMRRPFPVIEIPLEAESSGG
jgi:hypothetical protein